MGDHHLRLSNISRASRRLCVVVALGDRFDSAEELIFIPRFQQRRVIPDKPLGDFRSRLSVGASPVGKVPRKRVYKSVVVNRNPKEVVSVGEASIAIGPVARSHVFLDPHFLSRPSNNSLARTFFSGL
jgi:hypothetical protein